MPKRKLIPVLLESSKDGSGQFAYTGIKQSIDHRGYPFLVRFFRNLPRAVRNADVETRLTASITAMLSPQYQIITRWGLTDQFSPTFSFAGYGPFSFTTNLTLIATPEKIETPEKATFYFGCLEPATSVTEYQVYRDSRIIRHHLGPEELREGVRTEQWRFLGKHRSGRINRDYFVYGMYDLLGLTRS